MKELQSSMDEFKQVMKKFDDLRASNGRGLEVTSEMKIGSGSEEIKSATNANQGNGAAHKVFDNRSTIGISNRKVLISGYNQDEDCLYVETLEYVQKKLLISGFSQTEDCLCVETYEDVTKSNENEETFEEVFMELCNSKDQKFEISSKEEHEKFSAEEFMGKRSKADQECDYIQGIPQFFFRNQGLILCDLPHEGINSYYKVGGRLINMVQTEAIVLGKLLVSDEMPSDGRNKSLALIFDPGGRNNLCFYQYCVIDHALQVQSSLAYIAAELGLIDGSKIIVTDMLETTIVSHCAKFGSAFLVWEMFVKMSKREALRMIHLMPSVMNMIVFVPGGYYCNFKFKMKEELMDNLQASGLVKLKIEEMRMFIFDPGGNLPTAALEDVDIVVGVAIVGRLLGWKFFINNDVSNFFVVKFPAETNNHCHVDFIKGSELDERTAEKLVDKNPSRAISMFLISMFLSAMTSSPTNEFKTMELSTKLQVSSMSKVMHLTSFKLLCHMFHLMEQCLQQTISFFAKAVQRPGCLASRLKRRMRAISPFLEQVTEGNSLNKQILLVNQSQIARNQPINEKAVQSMLQKILKSEINFCHGDGGHIGFFYIFSLLDYLVGNCLHPFSSLLLISPTLEGKGVFEEPGM